MGMSSCWSSPGDIMASRANKISRHGLRWQSSWACT